MNNIQNAIAIATPKLDYDAIEIQKGLLGGRVQMGLFEGKDIVNLYFPENNLAFIVCSFLEAGEIIADYGYDADEVDFLYID